MIFLMYFARRLVGKKPNILVGYTACRPVSLGLLCPLLSVGSMAFLSKTSYAEGITYDEVRSLWVTQSVVGYSASETEIKTRYYMILGGNPISDWRVASNSCAGVAGCALAVYPNERSAREFTGAGGQFDVYIEDSVRISGCFSSPQNDTLWKVSQCIDPYGPAAAWASELTFKNGINNIVAKPELCVQRVSVNDQGKVMKALGGIAYTACLPRHVAFVSGCKFTSPSLYITYSGSKVGAESGSVGNMPISVVCGGRASGSIRLKGVEYGSIPLVGGKPEAACLLDLGDSPGFPLHFRYEPGQPLQITPKCYFRNLPASGIVTGQGVLEIKIN